MMTVCDCREKYESLMEKESRKNQLNSVGHNHSHDSAIDADLQEWELETLHFEVVIIIIRFIFIQIIEYNDMIHN